MATDGGIFAFGDAGSSGPPAASSSTSRSSAWRRRRPGSGYWLVATDGGIFAFGDAAFFGSTGGITLNQPIVGHGADPVGQGLLAGRRPTAAIFAFGDAAKPRSIRRDSGAARP